MAKKLANTRSMLVISDFKSPEALKGLHAKLVEAFPNVKEREYIFLVNEKKLPEMLPMFKGVNYLCLADFNFLGKLKSERIELLIKNNRFECMLCFCDKLNKSVYKFTEGLKIKNKIGYERKSLPTFDLGFIVEEPNDDYLIQLVQKYF
jgi:hypothetical protein